MKPNIIIARLAKIADIRKLCKAVENIPDKSIYKVLELTDKNSLVHRYVNIEKNYRENIRDASVHK